MLRHEGRLLLAAEVEALEQVGEGVAAGGQLRAAPRTPHRHLQRERGRGLGVAQHGPVVRLHHIMISSLHVCLQSTVPTSQLSPGPRRTRRSCAASSRGPCRAPGLCRLSPRRGAGPGSSGTWPPPRGPGRRPAACCPPAPGRGTQTRSSTSAASPCSRAAGGGGRGCIEYTRSDTTARHVTRDTYP